MCAKFNVLYRETNISQQALLEQTQQGVSKVVSGGEDRGINGEVRRLAERTLSFVAVAKHCLGGGIGSRRLWWWLGSHHPFPSIVDEVSGE